MAGLSGAILAAGLGQRLRGGVGGLPKPLVELRGQPLLLRQIDLLMRVGASPIHVIINPETSCLMHKLVVCPPDGVQLLVADTANSMESLLRLGDHIPSGLFVLMTVDAVMFPGDLRNFVTHATKIVADGESKLAGVLGVVEWQGDVNPLFAEIDEGGIITAFRRSQPPMVTAGVYLLSTAVFNHAAEARMRRLDAMRRFFGLVLERGTRFAALRVPKAIDIDNPADLRAAEAMLARESE